MRSRLLVGFLTFVGVLLLAQLGAPGTARSLSCAASVGPLPPAPVFSAELRAGETMLDAAASVDLFARYSWGICRGLGPRVTLEARAPGGEFAPAGGVAIYRRGTGWSCTGFPASAPPVPPAPVAACTIDWGTEEVSYVAAASETTDYRLRVGPLTSDTVTVTVANPRPEERCEEVAHYLAKPWLQVTPERTRIVFGESVRVRGTFAYEICGRLLRPDSLPAIESRRAGAVYTNQPAQNVLSGPVRESNGDVVYEFAPPETTEYRLFYLGDFGGFTTVEVTPRLELRAGRAAADSLSVRIQAQATSSLGGAQVRIERWSGSTWKLLRTTTLSDELSAVTRIAVRGNAEVRAVVPATRHYARGVSSTLLVRADRSRR